MTTECQACAVRRAHNLEGPCPACVKPILRSADHDDVPFARGRWGLAKSGRSVNLPNGGKIRQEATKDRDVDAANMRLVQMGPAMYAMMLDYRDALREPEKLTGPAREALIRWIDALEEWVKTGDDSQAAELEAGEGTVTPSTPAGIPALTSSEKKRARRR